MDPKIRLRAGGAFLDSASGDRDWEDDASLASKSKTINPSRFIDPSAVGAIQRSIGIGRVVVSAAQCPFVYRHTATTLAPKPHYR